MNKKLLFIVSFAVLVAGSLFYLVNNRAEPGKMKDAMRPPATANPSETTENGFYVDYSPTVLSEYPGQKVLFFHASWCPQCRAIEKDIEEDGPANGWTIIKVDYDSHQALRQKYGVTLQTTFVKVDDQGNKLSSYVAYDEPTLEAVKRNFLNR
jgi:thiol-disulfide isomerase/thioredoxin